MSVGIGKFQLAHNKTVRPAPPITRNWGWAQVLDVGATGSETDQNVGVGSGGTTPTRVLPTPTLPCAHQIQSEALNTWFFNATSTSGMYMPVNANPMMVFDAWVINALAGAGNDSVTALLATDVGLPNNSANNLVMGNKIGFYCTPGTGNWKAFVTVAGVKTEVNTGVSAAALLVRHLFEWVCNFTAGTVQFFIDNVLVATIAQMPAANTIFVRQGAFAWFNATAPTINTGQVGCAFMYFEMY